MVVVKIQVRRSKDPGGIEPLVIIRTRDKSVKKVLPLSAVESVLCGQDRAFCYATVAEDGSIKLGRDAEWEAW